ncbi:hypothetical protein [Streptomyces bacillaris]|uniref:hypothetical protein n=1 Tax=Streptomyces bacillaris TaxID=68179 RepID=UPI003632A06B
MSSETWTMFHEARAGTGRAAHRVEDGHQGAAPVAPGESEHPLAALFRSYSAGTTATEDSDGLHVKFCPPEDDDRYADGGTLFVPRAVLDSWGS